MSSNESCICIRLVVFVGNDVSRNDKRDIRSIPLPYAEIDELIAGRIVAKISIRSIFE